MTTVQRRTTQAVEIITDTQRPALHASVVVARNLQDARQTKTHALRYRLYAPPCLWEERLQVRDRCDLLPL